MVATIYVYFFAVLALLLGILIGACLCTVSARSVYKQEQETNKTNWQEINKFLS